MALFSCVVERVVRCEHRAASGRCVSATSGVVWEEKEESLMSEGEYVGRLRRFMTTGRK